MMSKKFLTKLTINHIKRYWCKVMITVYYRSFTELNRTIRFQSVGILLSTKAIFSWILLLAWFPCYIITPKSRRDHGRTWFSSQLTSLSAFDSFLYLSLQGSVPIIEKHWKASHSTTLLILNKFWKLRTNSLTSHVCWVH